MSLGTVPSYNFDSESLHPHDSNVSVRESSGLILLVYFEVVLFYIYPRIHVFLYIINPCYFSQLLSLLLVDVPKGITYHFITRKLMWPTSIRKLMNRRMLAFQSCAHPWPTWGKTISCTTSHYTWR